MSWGGKYKLEEWQNSLEMAPEQGFWFLWVENSNRIFNGNARETKEIVDLIKVRITYLALTRTELTGDYNLDTMQNMASCNGDWEVGLSSTWTVQLQANRLQQKLEEFYGWTRRRFMHFLGINRGWKNPTRRKLWNKGSTLNYQANSWYS